MLFYNVLIQQWDGAGRCIEVRDWHCEPFALHALMWHAQLKGCVKMRAAPLD